MRIVGFKRLSKETIRHNDLVYPDVGGTVICPDWKPEATYQNGLFFITEDACDFDLSPLRGDWIVAELEDVIVVDGGWAKARVAKIIHRCKSRYAPIEFMPEGFAEKWVAQNGWSLWYLPMKFRTPEVCRIALENGGDFRDVPGRLKTPEMCMAAVERKGWDLKYVPDRLKTPEMCMAAVEQSEYAIELVPNKFKTPEMCMAAVKKNGFMLQYIPAKLKTPEMCWAAIEQGSWNFEYVPDRLKTLEMCKVAVKESRDNLKYVPRDFYFLC